MKRTLKTLIIVLLAVGVMQALAASGADIGVTDSTPQIQYWGNARDGMQMGAGFSDASFRVGEPVELWLAMRNASDKTHSIDLFPIEQRYDLAVVDSYGKAVPLTEYGKYMFDNIGIPSARSEELGPGQSFLGMFPLSKVYDMSKPGVYFVRVCHGERNTSQGARWIHHTLGLIRTVIGDVKDAVSSPRIQIWGSVIDGLQVGAGFSDAPFRVGEPVYILPAIRNTSDRVRDIEVGRIDGYFQVELVDQYGKAVPLTANGKGMADDKEDRTAGSSTIHLQPNQYHTEIFPLSEFYVLSKPGVYYATVIRTERNTSEGIKLLEHKLRPIRIVISELDLQPHRLSTAPISERTVSAQRISRVLSDKVAKLEIAEHLIPLMDWKLDVWNITPDKDPGGNVFFCRMCSGEHAVQVWEGLRFVVVEVRRSDGGALANQNSDLLSFSLASAKEWLSDSMQPRTDSKRSVHPRMPRPVDGMTSIVLGGGAWGTSDIPDPADKMGFVYPSCTSYTDGVTFIRFEVVGIYSKSPISIPPPPYTFLGN